MDLVTYSVREKIAELVIQNPPVNSINRGVRIGIVTGIERAENDPDVAAVLIRSDGAEFCAGSDVLEYSTGIQGPSLPDLCRTIENCSKPVVAALHGHCLGGGLELALSAHYRMAAPDTKLGFSDINLGLLPGAGGTQRLPRLVGAKIALQMILSGTPIDVQAAQDHNLIDMIAKNKIRVAGMNLARRVIEKGKGVRQTSKRREGFSDPGQFRRHISDVRKMKLSLPSEISRRIIDCVEAAQILPFQAGMEFESVAFNDCFETDFSKGLRHAFEVERMAAKPPKATGVAGVVHPMAIYGAAAVGVGVAITALNANLSVVMIDPDKDALERAKSQIQSRLDDASNLDLLQITSDVQDTADCQIAIETTDLDLAGKGEILTDMADYLPDTAIIASHVDTVNLDDLGQKFTHPDRLIGLSFGRLAHVVPLVELIRGRQSSDAAVLTGYSLLRGLGKTAVLSNAADGAIASRLLAAFRHAADISVLLGATPVQVDKAMVAYGFAAGPFHGMDAVGLDKIQRDQAQYLTRFGDVVADGTVTSQLCENGSLGIKTHKGYYKYSKDSNSANPVLPDIIASARAQAGFDAGDVPAVDIQRLCLMAFVNEGGRIIDDTAVTGIEAIDTAAILGAGFPRFRGGPMFAAETFGLTRILNDLRALADVNAFWTPSDAIIEAVKQGQKFQRMAG